MYEEKNCTKLWRRISKGFQVIDVNKDIRDIRDIRYKRRFNKRNVWLGKHLKIWKYNFFYYIN